MLSHRLLLADRFLPAVLAGISETVGLCEIGTPYDAYPDSRRDVWLEVPPCGGGSLSVTASRELHTREKNKYDV